MPPEDAELIFGDDEEDSYSAKKKKKIRALLGEQKFAIKGKVAISIFNLIDLKEKNFWTNFDNFFLHLSLFDPNFVKHLSLFQNIC